MVGLTEIKKLEYTYTPVFTTSATTTTISCDNILNNTIAYTPYSSIIGTITLDNYYTNKRINCPNCGAPLGKDKFQCKYCGTYF